MELIQIGDLHLTDASGSGGLSKYVQDSDAMVLAECERVLEYARKKGIKTVVQAGDVCDNPRMSYGAQLQLMNFLDKHTEFDFHFILG